MLRYSFRVPLRFEFISDPLPLPPTPGLPDCVAKVARFPAIEPRFCPAPPLQPFLACQTGSLEAVPEHRCEVVHPSSLQRPPPIVQRNDAAASLQAGQQAGQSPSPIQELFPLEVGIKLGQGGADEFVCVRDG
jgi:hypothetical protein